MSWVARYDGVCAEECGERIHPGDEVVRGADGKLRHVECAANLAFTNDETTNASIVQLGVECPDCHRIRPCRCVD